MGVTQTIVGRLEENLSKWNRHVLRMEDNRWHERIVSRSPEGRLQHGRSEVLWEKEVESVVKQRNLTSDRAVNRQIWRIKNSNCWTSGKLIHS
jgi:hypothetical protein